MQRVFKHTQKLIKTPKFYFSQFSESDSFNQTNSHLNNEELAKNSPLKAVSNVEDTIKHQKRINQYFKDPI